MTQPPHITHSTLATLESEDLEVRLLLEAIRLKYGYDFRLYSKASIKRRIKRRLENSGLGSISELQHSILYDTVAFEALLLDLSVNVTEMFRDPTFFRALREQVAPALQELPQIKVWHAGCATGEEVYSMAILLKETGLYDKALLYATDVNEVVLAKARDGIYPAEHVREYTANHIQAGGTKSLADYYSARYGSVIMHQALKKNIVFADHNLVTDGVFGEMDVIVCRNVLIYFDRELQDRVFRLFDDSLREGGFLCIGSKETMQFASCTDGFDPVVAREKIYRKTAALPTVPDDDLCVAPTKQL